MVKSDFITIILALLSILIWIYTYIRLKSNKLYSFAFIVGSLGLFTISIFFFRDILEALIINIQLKLFDILKNIFYTLEIFVQDRTIIVKTTSVVKAITLNYECSGLIEILVYSSIVLFYPIHSKSNKFRKFIVGNLVILAANMLRLLIIVLSVGFVGVETFELVHLLIGRIVFYFIIIILYYIVLTKYHISQYKEV